MAITALDIKDKTFSTKLRGYSPEEVDDFLDIIYDDYEELVRDNRTLATRIKDLDEKLAYFDEMKESLSKSVILAQETAEKVKTSAADESANLLAKAKYDSTHLIEEAKAKASEILRDATDEAKRVAVETEDLKRQSRIFHQRLLAAVEGQLGLANAPEWNELLQPTAVYLQNSDAAFKEVVEKVLDEYVPESNDAASFDATRQFTPEEMAELQRRVAESNKQLEAETSIGDTQPVEIIAPEDFVIQEREEVENDTDEHGINLNETQTFKLNINE
ncbi:DivIVA domain-containing protein [Streptococcus dentiloxodontae]